MKAECSVVVPVCNEERNLPTLHLRLTATLRKLAVPYEIIYVDDGSTDETPIIIGDLRRDDPAVKGIFLSRNFGHQAALCAGLEAATGRAVVTLDGDLQDPPELITKLLEKWHEGYQVVHARRRRRQENKLKLAACYVYYRFLRKLSDVPVHLDTGDYALMDRSALEHLNGLPERTRFIRGLRSWVGFKQAEVEYDRDPRRDGQSKYPFLRLLRLGLDGVVSLSDKPLQIIVLLGAVAMVLALAGVVGGLIALWRGGGSAILVGALLALFGSIQLFSLGIVSEYIARIYHEVRGRPLYLVRERVGFKTHPEAAPNVLRFLDTEPTLRQEAATVSRLKRSRCDSLTLRDD